MSGYTGPSKLDVPIPLEVSVESEPKRMRCATCHLRRVVYRVYIEVRRPGLTFVDPTEARCADCWGMNGQLGRQLTPRAPVDSVSPMRQNDDA